MSTYPRHVRRYARRAAERVYRRLATVDIPDGYDLDDLAEVTTDHGFALAALPERADNDDEH